jgi:FtsH-binding integral membrane protein
MKKVNRMNSHQVKFNPIVNSVKMNDNLEREEDVKSNLQSETKKMLTMNSMKKSEIRLNTNNSEEKNDVYIYRHSKTNVEETTNMPKRNSRKCNSLPNKKVKDGFEISELQKKIRLKFIRKVYIIFFIHLLITLGLSCLCLIKKIREFASSHLVVLIVVGVIAFGVLIFIECFNEASRKMPMNYLLFIFWILLEGYLLITLCSYCDRKLVLSCIGMMVGVSIGLIIYSYYVKLDYSFLGGLLCCFVMGIIFFVVCGVIFGKWLYILICFGGVFIYSSFLVYNSKIVMKRYDRLYGANDHLIASLNLYLDIINIINYFLNFVGCCGVSE